MGKRGRGAERRAANLREARKLNDTAWEEGLVKNRCITVVARALGGTGQNLRFLRERQERGRHDDVEILRRAGVCLGPELKLFPIKEDNQDDFQEAVRYASDVAEEMVPGISRTHRTVGVLFTMLPTDEGRPHVVLSLDSEQLPRDKRRQCKKKKGFFVVDSEAAETSGVVTGQELADGIVSYQESGYDVLFAPLLRRRGRRGGGKKH